jgi:hypothetical protein
MSDNDCLYVVASARSLSPSEPLVTVVCRSLSFTVLLTVASRYILEPHRVIVGGLTGGEKASGVA